MNIFNWKLPYCEEGAYNTPPFQSLIQLLTSEFPIITKIIIFAPVLIPVYFLIKKKLKLSIITLAIYLLYLTIIVLLYSCD